MYTRRTHFVTLSKTTGLTKLGNVVLGNVVREGDRSNKKRCVCSPVVESEALMLAHLGGGFPRYLNNAAIQHFGEDRRSSRYYNTK